MPVILTIRRSREGGQYDDDESLRLAQLAKAAGNGFAFVDLEEDLEAPAVEQKIRSAGCRIIRSYHDLEGVPDDLAAKMRGMKRHPGDLPKAAVSVGSMSELSLLYDASQELGDLEKILLGMGDEGFPTRVLSSLFGSYLTFASPPGVSAAAGHTDPTTLADVYRYPHLSVDTQVFGIIGHPLMHTQSPQIHNPAFSRLGLDAVYIPFQTRELPAFMLLADKLDVQGVSVTIPHKVAVVKYLDGFDESVRATGACNTIIRRQNGWWGTNTDVEGFIAPLLEKIPRPDLPGLGVTVIGAGGAARSIVYALTKEGCRVLVVNRTESRARKLAEEFACEWSDANSPERVADYNDLIVQTTSAGMQPQPGVDPLPAYRFTGKECVYEIVYNPAITPFLDRALASGCSTLSGISMLKAQAKAQFRLFTGKDFPAPKSQQL